jgi:hypothetical protein
MDRRYFLKSSGIAFAGFGLMAAAPNFLQQFAERRGSQKQLRQKENSGHDFPARRG